MSTIVDIDGTLLRNGSQPIHRVIDYVNSLPGSVIIVTGRNVSERRQTEAALHAAGVKYSRLIMNPGSSADTAKYKEETGRKLKGSVNLAIDNNATMRRAYERAAIKTMDPAQIAHTTKGVIMDNFWDGTAFGKRDRNTAQRRAMAQTGTAMPDGSFPIANVTDLHNAIQSIGRASNPAAAKEHIKRRARALGATDQLPDTWKSMDEGITPTQTGGMCTPDSINCMDKTCKMCATKPY
jgi:hypothetical protein